MKATSPRRLIIGAAVGYDWPKIAPFARSLKEGGYQGDTWMLVGRMSKADRQLLLHHRIRPIRVSAFPAHPSRNLLRLIFNRRLRSLYHSIPSCIDRLPFPVSTRETVRFFFGTKLSHILCARFLHALRLLRLEANSAYDEVMLTDVRDVIFQGSPFPDQIPAPQLFILEDENVKLGSEPHNTRWIGKVFGYDKVDALSNRPISCAGTTYGTRSGIMEYLEAMSTEIIRNLHAIAGQPGFDQGIHNYLISCGRFPRAQFVPNGSGPVLTLQEMDVSTLRLSHDGVRTRAGRLVPVLHQYDRHPSLEAYFSHRFGN